MITAAECVGQDFVEEPVVYQQCEVCGEFREIPVALTPVCVECYCRLLEADENDLEDATA